MEHRVQIPSLNFGKDVAKLERVQNRARSAENLTTQGGWKDGAQYILKAGENEWAVGRHSPECVLMCKS